MNDKHSNNGKSELPPEKAGIEERTMAMVTAYALDQVTEVERKAVEGLLEKNPALRKHVESIRQLGKLLQNTSDAKNDSSGKLRNLLTQRLDAANSDEKTASVFQNTPDDPNAVDAPSPAKKLPAKKSAETKSKWKLRFRFSIVEVLACAGIVIVLAGLLMPAIQSARESARRAEVANNMKRLEIDSSKLQPLIVERRYQEEGDGEAANGYLTHKNPTETADPFRPSYANSMKNQAQGRAMSGTSMPPSGSVGYLPSREAPSGPAGVSQSSKGLPAQGGVATEQAAAGPFKQIGGYQGDGYTVGRSRWNFGWTANEGEQRSASYDLHDDVQYSPSGEQYQTYIENPYFNVKDVPLSTFAIDVDTASYANMRRFLNNNQLPPSSSIRTEELLNYFTYSYPGPTDSRPFAVHLEAAQCPWNGAHRLVRVGLKGKEIHKAERPSSNLVFLIDTSGSMQSEDKLPLLKSALTLLTRELTANDRVTIVTYAGDAGLKLPPTSGNDKERIIASLDQLLAGGSTHGSAGITLAYEQAKANFIQEGTNRVILCTDGDLNVGVTSDNALVELIKEKAKTGVYLSVMGFGTGNLKDGKLEKLADHGNGVYAYIDGLKEARKVFVEQMSGSLVTIAKDVKIQLEFNPKQVQAYRLLGYENRVMDNKDFRNDKKDAGEIGAGHTVTALYEIVPTNVTPPSDVKLRYQPVPEPRTSTPAPSDGAPDDISKELLTVRLRYKNPEATENDPAAEFETSLSNPGATVREASENFRFASAVAMAGLVLRDSRFRGDSNLDAAIEIASTALGEDPQGWRAEFIDLLRKARTLQSR